MRSASVALRFHLRARQVNHRCRLNSFELGKWAVLKRSTVVVLNRCSSGPVRSCPVMSA
jgi:hypothetical protein